MFFSESSQEWRPIPQWVQFLINFGYLWPKIQLETRRIALISMPCDSAAAGLVTLGAMIRDLANPRANDVSGHYDRLLRYARQYLESCRDCDCEPCDPQVKGCGYLTRATGKLRSRDSVRTTVEISERTDFEEGKLALTYPRHSTGMWNFPNPATEWHVDGEPPVELVNPEEGLSPGPYRDIIGAVDILPENLRQTYSGLCMASRATGEASSREMCSSTRFCDVTGEYRLDELLAIHEWSPGRISRVNLFNTRIEQLDRAWAPPSLVIADGDIPFLKAIRNSQFQQSDILGVIHRTMDRDRLEAIGNGILPNQWYSQDEEMLYELPPVARGISVSILKRRT
jgi:hypothetical protein